MTVDVERQFQQCIHRVYDLPQADIDTRTSSTTYFLRGKGTDQEQRLALTTNGSLRLATHAFIWTNEGPFFIPIDFCHNLIDFLILASAWYEKSRYYGGSLLQVRFGLQKEARLYPGLPRRDAHLQGSDIFEPPLESIPAINSGVAQIHVVLSPITTERLHAWLDEIMNDLARLAGRVLSTRFRPISKGMIEDALKRVGVS